MDLLPEVFVLHEVGPLDRNKDKGKVGPELEACRVEVWVLGPGAGAAVAGATGLQVRGQKKSEISWEQIERLWTLLQRL